MMKSFINYIFPGITWSRTGISALHAFGLIAASLLWLGYVNFLDGFGFMNDYMNLRTFVNEIILRKPPETDFADKLLLLNTSRNNALLPLDNDNTINTVITDRKVLAEKLKILDNNSDRIAFIICDVFFEFPSDNSQSDSLLQRVILSLSAKNKFVMPAYFNDQDMMVQNPVFEGTSGLSQYRSSFLNSQFLKYSFILYNRYRQMPLVAYEAISGAKMEKKKLGFIRYYTHKGRWVLNTVIPEFRYSQSNLSEGVNYFQLGLFEDYFIQDGQVVIIGDFEAKNDVHQTMAALNSGPVVITNVLVSLIRGDHRISLTYLLLLFGVFFYVSFHSFYCRFELPEAKTRYRKIINQLIGKRNYLILLLLVYISMIFFHHYLHILILLSYFGLIELVEHYIFNKNNS
ncbi:MAG: hypothetical protein AB9834_10395 [Lentimicrobium sp.]